MKVLRILDRKNYDASLPITKRTAIRGIILKEGKIALIKSKKIGEYKLPGGGQETDETFEETLIREVKEETGLTVIETSIKEYGMLKEIRHDIYDEAVIEQTSYYYSCDVASEVDCTNLSASEIAWGYSLQFVPIEEAIKNNESLLSTRNDTTWIERETFVLKKLLEEQTILA